MLSLTVSLSLKSAEISLQIDDNPEISPAFSLHRDERWTILCWGDPARAIIDSGLINAIQRGEHNYCWGRSWIAIDAQSNRIHGAVDTMGLFPMWIIETSDSITLATQRRSLLNNRLVSDLDPRGLQSLVALGQLFDDQTIWTNTRYLQGRTVIDIDRKDVSKCRTDQGPYLGNWQTRFDDALEAFVESVRMSLNAQPNALVSLSGGLDSRLILAAATALGKKVTGLSYGHPESGDVQIARELATTAGIPLFTGNAQQERSTWSLLKRIAQLGGGEVPVHHAHALLDPELLEQTRGQVILTGTGAETARAFYYDRGMPGYSILGQGRIGRKALMAKAKRYIKQEYWKNADSFLQISPACEAFISDLLERKLQQHSEYFHTPASYLDNFYLQNRVSRMVIAGQQLLDEHYLRSHPFMEKDALFYMAHLPVRFKLGSTFHRRAIAKLAPHLANIRWDKTNRPLAAGLPFSIRYPALASRLGINRWSKQTEGMFDYQALLAVIPDGVLQRALTNMQCAPDAMPAGQLHQLRQHLSFSGCGAVWSHLPPQTTSQTGLV